MKKQLRILVSGRVQGVFFRASTKKTADQLSIQGYVRNLLDGRVEIIASGESGAIEPFLTWCQQGPKFARVENVEIEPVQTQLNYNSFEIW